MDDPHFHPEFQMDWFEKDGRTVRTPFPVHPERTTKLGEVAWLRYHDHYFRQVFGLFGTVVSEDVSSDRRTPCYLVRTNRGKYAPCYAGNVMLLGKGTIVRLLAGLVELIHRAWRGAPKEETVIITFREID